MFVLFVFLMVLHNIFSFKGIIIITSTLSYAITEFLSFICVVYSATKFSSVPFFKNLFRYTEVQNSTSFIRKYFGKILVV